MIQVDPPLTKAERRGCLVMLLAVMLALTAAGIYAQHEQRQSEARTYRSVK